MTSPLADWWPGHLPHDSGHADRARKPTPVRQPSTSYRAAFVRAKIVGPPQDASRILWASSSRNPRTARRVPDVRFRVRRGAHLGDSRSRASASNTDGSAPISRQRAVGAPDGTVDRHLPNDRSLRAGPAREPAENPHPPPRSVRPLTGPRSAGPCSRRRPGVTATAPADAVLEERDSLPQPVREWERPAAGRGRRRLPTGGEAIEVGPVAGDPGAARVVRATGAAR